MRPSSLSLKNIFSYEKIVKVGNINDAQRRLYIGIGALLTKPAIDYYINKDLDEKTRKYSMSKAIARVAIGTASGFAARSVGFKLGKYLLKSGKLKNPYKNPLQSEKFVAGIGNTVGFLTTILSISFIDVPLINKAVNKIAEKLEKKSDKDTEKGRVVFNA